MKVVLDMQDRRPIWAMPDWVVDRVRSALPPGALLQVIRQANDGSGDGSGRLSEEVRGAVSGATVYLGYGIAPELLGRDSTLEWVHSGAAGVNSVLSPEMMRSDVLFTNSAGVHADPMSETVLGMLLYFFRGLDLSAQANLAGEGRWNRDAFHQAGSPMRELGQSRIGVIGFGGVGSAVARKCALLGAEVLALRRGGGRPGRSDPTALPGQRVEVLEGPAGLERILTECDGVVLTVPETDETRGMIDAEALGRMRPGAVLLNVGRGRVVDSAAVLEALRTRQIRGFGFDVFDPEPVPDDHPIWLLPGVVHTPHVSAVTRGFWERETRLIVENLGRFQRGESMLNLVSREAGY